MGFRVQAVTLKGFTNVGVVIDLAEGPTLLFAKNGKLVADGKAVAITLDFKGNSGLLPCGKCANVLIKGALTDPEFPLANPDGKLVEITHPTLSGCIENTNESIFKNADELQRLHALWKQGRLTKGNFELTEKSVGIKYNPKGILWNRRLRSIVLPMDFILEDWSHVYLCKGIGGDEIWCILQRVKARDRTLYTVLRDEVRQWTWPRHRQTQCKNA